MISRDAAGRWLPGQSANPTGDQTPRRFYVIRDALACDFGGLDSMSSIDRALLEQAARLLARSERSAAADATVRLSSEARRILTDLRRRSPQARDAVQTLDEWMADFAARKAAEKAQDAPGVEDATAEE